MRNKPWVAAVGFAVVAGAALMFVNPKALTGEAGGAGCTVEDYADSQLAKREGQYLVMEVMVAGQFTDDLSSLTDPVALSNSNQNNCYATTINDASLLGAKMAVDFGSCSDQNGRIEIAVAAEYPQGTDLSALGGLNGGDIPSEIPPDFDPENPGDLPADVPSDLPEDLDAVDIEPTAIAYDLTMYDTERYGVLIEGLLGYTTPSAGGEQDVRTDLSFDFLDYAGTLTTRGKLRTDGDTSEIDFTGTFKSVGGLDWNVDATGLKVNPDCKGLMAGELVATYSNPAIEHLEVVATFDGACNGCAQVAIDGRKVSDVCIPEALGF
jgi:hypothetical protein